MEWARLPRNSPSVSVRGMIIDDHAGAQQVGYRAVVYDPCRVMIPPTVTVRPETISSRNVPFRQWVEHHALRETDGSVAGQIIRIIVKGSVVSIRLPYVDKQPHRSPIARFLQTRFRR